jgi:hypothetical protein
MIVLPIYSLRDASAYFNYFEVGLWTFSAVLLGVHGLRRQGPVRRDCLIGAAALLAFAGSDWAEAKTGNTWWDPWWLLAWKAACVLTFLVLLLRAVRRTRATQKTPPSPGTPGEGRGEGSVGN